MKTVALFCGLILCAFQARAQAQTEPCGTPDYIEDLDKKYPGFKASVDQAYMESVREMQRSRMMHGKGKFMDTTFVIPVVFHVVYRNQSQNLADEHIIDQIKVLNACFNRENADTVNTRDVFKPFAGSARIRFELAKVDPDGNPTNGITRTPTTVTTFNTFNRATQYDYVKESRQGGKDAWDTRRYMNIWVCNLDFTTGQLGLFGYAFPPTNAEFWQNRHYTAVDKQGVVLHYEIVGSDNPRNLNPTIYTNQKTAVHEVGHFLGLRHTWGDGGCYVDDYIDDTPRTGSMSRGCNHNKNTCFQDTFPDQIENYMDYGSEVCSNMFTHEQIEVMRYNLANLRTGLARKEMVYLIPLDTEDVPGQPNVTAVYVETAYGDTTYLLYPNPVKGQLNFYSQQYNQAEVAVEIQNMLGQVVYDKVLFKSDYLLNIPELNFADGVYLVHLRFADRVVTHKLQFTRD